MNLIGPPDEPPEYHPTFVFSCDVCDFYEVDIFEKFEDGDECPMCREGVLRGEEEESS